MQRVGGGHAQQRVLIGLHGQFVGLSPCRRKKETKPPMVRYTLTIQFTVNRELTPSEQDIVIGASVVQVAEPVDENGDDLDADIQVESATIDPR